MPTFQPNPAAEATAAFDVVKPGVYRMRVKDIKDFNSKAGDPCWKVQLEFIDQGACFKLDGGPAKPGNVFDNGLNTSQEKQGRLRNFVESCGKDWSGFTGNSDELLGSEVDVKLIVDDYQGTQSNKVNRYLKAQ